MPTKVAIQDFKSDNHGREFKDVFSDAVDGLALEAALEEMNRPTAVSRMFDCADRYDLPPLAGCVREIEGSLEFLAAVGNRKSKKFGRLKKAIGVACKIVMAQQGFVPAFLEKSENPDVGRMEKYSQYFVTARKYRKP